MTRYLKILFLSFGHLIVDLSGIYLINVQYNYYDFKYIALFFIIYNLIAFGFQPIFGYYADLKNYYLLFTVLGLLLPILSLYLKGLGILAIVISTIGNALYHVGGGILSMNLFPDKAAPAGVFVAPGAIGVFLGVFFASHSYSYDGVISIIGILLLITIYLVLKSDNSRVINKKLNINFTIIIGLLLIIILIRGFIGSILIFSWSDNLIYKAILVFSVFIGKFMGGILGDCLGYKRVGIFGLLASAPLLLLGYYLPLLGFFGALFFNFTMGITLYLIIDSLGIYKGFAFGLTTLSLIIAFLPKMFGISFTFGLRYNLVVLILVFVGAYVLSIAVNIYIKGQKEGV
ncbi:hypothetical protein RJG79_07925 [Mycoplasmatota bacterium WC44]